MKTAFLSLACVTLLLQASAQSNPVLHHPESINTDGKFLYVSDIGKELAPTEKDGDGAIRKYTLDGKLVKASITAEKLNAPKGSAIVKGVLYVADVDRVVGINLASGKKVAEFSLVEFKTIFSNDICAKDDHTLFVSLTDVGKIIEIDLASKAMHEVAVPEIKGANGLVFDPKTNRLYVCTFSGDAANPAGEIGMIGWDKDGHTFYEKAADVNGMFDGLAISGDHELIVSDWVAFDKAAGILRKIDLNTRMATTLDLPVIAGPADFCYSTAKHTLYIPVMVESKLLIRELK
jgi:sugar lactone lactonase YvrE